MAWILALIGNHYKQLQCISLSSRHLHPALIGLDARTLKWKLDIGPDPDSLGHWASTRGGGEW